MTSSSTTTTPGPTSRPTSASDQRPQPGASVSLSIIAAVARNGAIGLDNKLLYWLPNDMRRFRQLTTGHTIVMGRRTFESLPKGALPNRRNCVLTRSATEARACELADASTPPTGARACEPASASTPPTGARATEPADANITPTGARASEPTSARFPGCECFASWDDFVASCQPGEEVYVIGGASVYRALIGKADRLCLTEVDDTPEEADAFFPDYATGWREVWREDHAPDDRHAHPYSFVDYVPERPVTAL